MSSAVDALRTMFLHSVSNPPERKFHAESSKSFNCLYPREDSACLMEVRRYLDEPMFPVGFYEFYLVRIVTCTIRVTTENRRLFHEDRTSYEKIVEHDIEYTKDTKYDARIAGHYTLYRPLHDCIDRVVILETSADEPETLHTCMRILHGRVSLEMHEFPKDPQRRFLTFSSRNPTTINRLLATKMETATCLYVENGGGYTADAFPAEARHVAEKFGFNLPRRSRRAAKRKAGQD